MGSPDAYNQRNSCADEPAQARWNRDVISSGQRNKGGKKNRLSGFDCV